jgi:NADH dehydrogenase [ubiquinone] 1 alpha subcomplex assembly factor 7
VTALLEELRRMIALDGPMPVARYMALCLSHPAHGYYITRDPLGAAGDFTTAPEISQMFGELIGLWAIEVWASMGSPSPLRFVELGPGRGTLMADALRAARLRPAFLEALEVDLVETSPVLRAQQRRRLGHSAVPTTWRAQLAEVPDGPAIVLANEFFDALPVRQFVSTESGWCERLVGLGSEGELVVGLSPHPEASLTMSAPPGAVLELPEAGLELVAHLAERLEARGGAALIIDYGHVGRAFGDTLQAVKGHAYAGPLAAPGEADLSTHVDFAKLAAAARAKGAKAYGPIPQGAFLRALGIEARAAALKRRATRAQAEAIEAALRRLTGSAPNEMGELFKVMAFAHPRLAPPPGFVPAGRSL